MTLNLRDDYLVQRYYEQVINNSSDTSVFNTELTTRINKCIQRVSLLEAIDFGNFKLEVAKKVITRLYRFTDSTCRFHVYSKIKLDLKNELMNLEIDEFDVDQDLPNVGAIFRDNKESLDYYSHSLMTLVFRAHMISGDMKKEQALEVVFNFLSKTLKAEVKYSDFY